MMEENQKPVSNCYAENYFGNLKTHILGGQKNLKCSRYLRKSREYVKALFKEYNLNIPKRKLTKQRKREYPDDEFSSQETWNKKTKTTDTHFTGKYLKMIAPLSNVENKNQLSHAENKNSQQDIVIVHDDMDETVLEKCMYCGFGRLNVTAEWVKCDGCGGWVHKNCDQSLQDYGETYFCEACVTNKIYTLDSKPDLREKCENAIKQLHEDNDHRDDIEQETRSQRQLPQWFLERRKRVIAFNFRIIMEARSSDRKIIMAKTIISQKRICTDAIKHGIDNEERAIQKYLMENKHIYTKCGLVVHNQYPYLAGSPDGLLDRDGIIEVKCPHKIRNEIPTYSNMDYFDEDILMRYTHDVHYQVQGLLEIVNRPWCILVIYTYQGLFIHKIERNREIFKSMLNRLNEFYYYYYLPTLIEYDVKNEIERKWRPFYMKLHF
ncbi:unnamed protein product [Phaedon cochleariae]|uniref:Zinc finger PHD-type domain-containing protein n=1 Tax=Phaedon cochleariae TaxID=80249 RepID=A0A9P0GRS2_PHACE|nr:unnamed protein product [Phaedon cochleariae]